MAEKKAEQCIIPEEIKNKKYKEVYPEQRFRLNEIGGADWREVLVIRIDGGLGRVIAMSWAITELAKHTRVRVVTSRPLVFWGNPYIESVHWLDDRDLFANVIRGNNYYELEPYTDPGFFNDAENWLDVAKRLLRIEWDTPQPCLFLAEHEKMGNYLSGNKPILFQPFGSTMQMNGADKSYRSMTIESAQYLADRLVEAWYTPYEVIKQGSQPVLRNCQMCDTPDLRLVISLCDRYPVVGCDSSLHHASKAFGKKAVVLWAGTDQERYGYDSNINMREYPFRAFTPMRLPMNSFDLDISNQGTNKFTKWFIDKVMVEIQKNF